MPLSDWQTNSYIIWPDKSDICWIIDAPFQSESIIDAINERNLTPSHLILTHAHIDHIAGAQLIKNTYPDIEIAIHQLEADHLSDPLLNLSAMMGQPITAPQPTQTLTHDDTLTIADLTFQIRHAPGHSPGSIILYQPENNIAITGDVLFAGSIGRTDFPTSAGHDTLIDSIKTQILTLPDSTKILPGHGPSTTVQTEHASNPFLQSTSP